MNGTQILWLTWFPAQKGKRTTFRAKTYAYHCNLVHTLISIPCTVQLLVWPCNCLLLVRMDKLSAEAFRFCVTFPTNSYYFCYYMLVLVKLYKFKRQREKKMPPPLAKAWAKKSISCTAMCGLTMKKKLHMYCKPKPIFLSGKNILDKKSSSSKWAP